MTTTNDAGGGAWNRIRNLTLPRNRGMIGSVCEALGDATFVPAWMWRVGFCCAVCFWGTGIVAYLVLMLCIPDEPTGNA